jgi:hypothetical protein
VARRSRKASVGICMWDLCLRRCWYICTFCTVWVHMLRRLHNRPARTYVVAVPLMRTPLSITLDVIQMLGRPPDEEVSICIVGLTDAMTALINSKQTTSL